MPAPLTLELTPEQRQQLLKARDVHSKAYIRERAAALLQISNGRSAREVARKGLLKTRDPDSVYSWLHRYEKDGFEGLFIKAGRGRKPAFSP